jgi:excisionase family DNA binding protein
VVDTRSCGDPEGLSVTERLLTARELANRLGVSTGALLRWTRAGKVPAAKLPSGAVRYDPERITAWLEQLAMAGDANRGKCHQSPNATRRRGVSSESSPVPLDARRARTKEEPDAC